MVSDTQHENYIPLQHQVLIKLLDIEPELGLSKIVLTQTSTDRTRSSLCEGYIVSFGPGAFQDEKYNGPESFGVKVGDRVIFYRSAGQWIQPLAGEDLDKSSGYRAIHYTDIILKVVEKQA